jgi:hypothetical protein
MMKMPQPQLPAPKSINHKEHKGHKDMNRLAMRINPFHSIEKTILSSLQFFFVFFVPFVVMSLEKTWKNLGMIALRILI